MFLLKRSVSYLLRLAQLRRCTQDREVLGTQLLFSSIKTLVQDVPVRRLRLTQPVKVLYSAPAICQPLQLCGLHTTLVTAIRMQASK